MINNEERRKIKKKQIKAWKNQKVNIRELEKLVKKEQMRKYKAEVKETKIKAEEKVSDLGRKNAEEKAILVLQ